jgi:6-phosphogluconolactonase
VTVDFTGRFVYVVGAAGVYSFAIGSAGTLTPVLGSPFAAGVGPDWVRIDPTNHFLYVVNGGDDTISAYAVDQSTGVLTTVPGSPFQAGTSPSSIVLVFVPQ